MPSRGPDIGGWFLEGLDVDVAARLVGLGEVRSFARGDVLMREDDDTPFLGIIVSGRVALKVRVPGHGDTTLLTVEPGEVVGWSAVTRPHRSTATVVAVTDVEAACIDASRLRTAFEADSAFAAAVQRRLLEALDRRMSAHRMQLLDIYGSIPPSTPAFGARGSVP